MSIEATLAGREARYGAYPEHAKISQALCDVLRAAPRWGNLDPTKKEALEMIAHKIARILNGDPNYGDNWHDIAGYATLVEQALEIVPAKEPATEWLCFHGDFANEGKKIPVGEACPTCYATR